MSSLVLIALCNVAVGADSDTYADAHSMAMKTGKPMVVMVSADWCPHCQVMKRDIIPVVRRRGLLKRVAFAIVDSDREQQLARQVTGGGLIPQMVMYRKTPQGWVRYVLIGGQSVESVENFISQGLAADQTKSAGKKAAEGNSPDKADGNSEGQSEDALDGAAKKS